MEDRVDDQALVREGAHAGIRGSSSESKRNPLWSSTSHDRAIRAQRHERRSQAQSLLGADGSICSAVQEGKEESETHKRSTAVVQPSQSFDGDVYAREEGNRGARDATLQHANSNRRRAKSTSVPVQRQSLTRPTAQQSKSAAEQAKADLDGRGMEAHALARNTKEDHVEVVWNIAESQVLRVRTRGDIVENMKRGAASSFAARLPVDKSLTAQTCALLRETAAHYKAILADVPPDTSPECVLATVMLNAERRESVDGARGTLVTAPIVRITVPKSVAHDSAALSQRLLKVRQPVLSYVASHSRLRDATDMQGVALASQTMQAQLRIAVHTMSDLASEAICADPFMDCLASGDSRSKDKNTRRSKFRSECERVYANLMLDGCHLHDAVKDAANLLCDLVGLYAEEAALVGGVDNLSLQRCRFAAAACQRDAKNIELAVLRSELPSQELYLHEKAHRAHRIVIALAHLVSNLEWDNLKVISCDQSLRDFLARPPAHTSIARTLQRQERHNASALAQHEMRTAEKRPAARDAQVLFAIAAEQAGARGAMLYAELDPEVRSAIREKKHELLRVPHANVLRAALMYWHNEVLRPANAHASLSLTALCVNAIAAALASPDANDDLRLKFHAYQATEHLTRKALRDPDTPVHHPFQQAEAARQKVADAEEFYWKPGRPPPSATHAEININLHATGEGTAHDFYHIFMQATPLMHVKVQGKRDTLLRATAELGVLAAGSSPTEDQLNTFDVVCPKSGQHHPIHYLSGTAMRDFDVATPVVAGKSAFTTSLLGKRLETHLYLKQLVQGIIWHSLLSGGYFTIVNTPHDSKRQTVPPLESFAEGEWQLPKWTNEHEEMLESSYVVNEMLLPTQAEVVELRSEIRQVLTTPSDFYRFFLKTYAFNKATLTETGASSRADHHDSCNRHKDGGPGSSNLLAGLDATAYATAYIPDNSLETYRLLDEGEWEEHHDPERRGDLGASLTRRLLLYDVNYNGTTEAVHAENPTGIRLIPVTDTEHAVEGYFAADGPAVSKFPTCSAAKPVWTFFKKITFAIILRVDFRPLQSAYGLERGAPAFSMEQRRALKSMRVIGKKQVDEHLDALQKGKKPKPSSGKEEREEAVDAIVRETEGIESVEIMADSLESSTPTWRCSAGEVAGLQDSLMSNRQSIASHLPLDRYQRAVRVWASERWLGKLKRDALPIARHHNDHHIHRPRAHTASDYSSSIRSVRNLGRTKGMDDNTTRAGIAQPTAVRVMMKLGIAHPIAARGIELAMYEITAVIWIQVNPTYIFKLLDLPEKKIGKADFVTLPALFAEALRTGEFDDNLLSFQISAWSDFIAMGIGEAFFTGRGGQHAMGVMRMLQCIRAIWARGRNNRDARYTSVEQLDEAAGLLPHVGGVRRERFVNTMLRWPCFEYYEDVELQVEKRQGNYQFVLSELGNSDKRHVNEVLADGRFIHLHTLRWLLDDACNNEVNSGTSGDPTSLTRLRPQILLAYAGDATTWHQNATSACELNTQEGFSDGSRPQRNFRSQGEPSPDLHTVPKEIVVKLGGRIFVKWTTVDNSSSDAAEKSMQAYATMKAAFAKEVAAHLHETDDDQQLPT